MDYEEALGAFLAAGIAVILLVLLVVIAVAVVLLIGKWKFYKKAGKGGWEVIIPFYNNFVLTQIAGLKWYWFLFLIGTLISYVLGNIIPTLSGLFDILGSVAALLGSISVYYNLSKKLHKGTGWIVLCIFFPDIVIAVEGYKKENSYDSTVVVCENGPFDNLFKGTTNNNQNVQANNVNVNQNVVNGQQVMPNNNVETESTDNNQNGIN